MMDSFIPRSLMSMRLLCFWCFLLAESATNEPRRPIFDSPMANVTVKEMTTAILPCSIKFRGKHQVIWTDQYSTLLTHEERRIIDDSRLSVERPFIKDWNLHIRNVKHDDQGLYNCQINTNPVMIKVVTLKVLQPPKILNNVSTDMIIAREGDTVTLMCNVSGIPPPTVTWLRLTNDEKGERQQKVGVNGEVLIIYNISRHCGDVYVCVASNGVPPDMKMFTEVSVQFPPEVMLPNVRLGQDVGKETILECQITANPQVEGHWLRDGKEIKTLAGRYRVEAYEEDVYTYSLTLRILNIEEGDFGEYTCRASNSLGEDKGSMTLYNYMESRPRAVETTSPAPLTTQRPVNTRQPHVHPVTSSHQAHSRRPPLKQSSSQGHHKVNWREGSPGANSHTNYRNGNPRRYGTERPGPVLVDSGRGKVGNSKENGAHKAVTSSLLAMLCPITTTLVFSLTIISGPFPRSA